MSDSAYTVSISPELRHAHTLVAVLRFLIEPVISAGCLWFWLLFRQNICSMWCSSAAKTPLVNNTACVPRRWATSAPFTPAFHWNCALIKTLDWPRRERVLDIHYISSFRRALFRQRADGTKTHQQQWDRRESICQARVTELHPQLPLTALKLRLKWCLCMRGLPNMDFQHHFKMYVECL